MHFASSTSPFICLWCFCQMRTLLTENDYDYFHSAVCLAPTDENNTWWQKATIKSIMLENAVFYKHNSHSTWLKSNCRCTNPNIYNSLTACKVPKTLQTPCLCHGSNLWRRVTAESVLWYTKFIQEPFKKWRSVVRGDRQEKQEFRIEINNTWISQS